MFRWMVDPGDSAANQAFALANAELYRSIDWALDIREAKFSFFETLIGVPADLVLRNPEFHFVMTRASAVEIAADRERFAIWSIAAEGLLESALEDTVIVVGGTGKKLKADLAQAYELRTQGLLT